MVSLDHIQKPCVSINNQVESKDLACCLHMVGFHNITIGAPRLDELKAYYSFYWCMTIECMLQAV